MSSIASDYLKYSSVFLLTIFSDFVRSMESMISDRERQEDEILALSSILDHNEFIYQKGSTIKCCFNIFPNLKAEKIEILNKFIENENRYSGSVSKVITIEHLPPIRLRIDLPQNYPSKQPPNYSITISWLPMWDSSFICQKLDEIWQANRESEILFTWIEFLKDDIFSFLAITDQLDISFMYMVFVDPIHYVESRLGTLCDSRVKNYGLFLNPIHFLKKYSKEQHKVTFEKGFYTCPICFDDYSGKSCLELENCKHIYCKQCLQQFISVKVNEGNVRIITCPDSLCSSEITFYEIRKICPNIANKYEGLLLQITLNTMNDAINCPRRTCQELVIKDMDEPLATCTKCNYNFCSFCKKGYHGVTPCEMEAYEVRNLIALYRNGNKQQQKQLEKQYGRKQIQAIVEKHLSDEYIKDNTKPCPSCCSLTEKIDGCNKMQCIYCQVSFCWLCGVQILAKNAYDHFSENGNSCYGRLFEGMDKLDLDEMNIEENILWFNE